MVIIEKATWLHLLFSLQGSVIQRIWKRVLMAVLFSALVTYVFLHYLELKDAPLLTPLPFSLIGLALAIFLGFRNNTSYDRFWEGRKLWGALVNTTRSLTRQTLTLCHSDDDTNDLRAFRKEQVYRLVAYVHAFRHKLRDEDTLDELELYLTQDERDALIPESNRPIAILQTMGDRFRDAWQRGWIDTFHLPVFEASLTELTNIQGGCERIHATPIPFAYNVLMHRIVAVYCFSLPFGILKEVGDLTPLVVFMISYGFFGLDAIGDEIEDPFGTDKNDLPLHSISTMIEVNIRQRLGESDELPNMRKSTRHILD